MNQGRDTLHRGATHMPGTDEPLLARLGRRLFLGAIVAWPAAAVAGIVQGAVTGVPPGTKMDVIKGTSKVAEIVVQTGQGYSIALEPGTYSVTCPTGKHPAIYALNVPVVQDIAC
jgi:uncharacterized transporter YbjL